MRFAREDESPSGKVTAPVTRRVESGVSRASRRANAISEGRTDLDTLTTGDPLICKVGTAHARTMNENREACVTQALGQYERRGHTR